MNLIRKALFLFLSLGLIFTSCQKDPDSILGNNMHGKDDLSAKYDTTFNIEAFSVSDDSIILQNSSVVLLGSSYSSVFGSATYNLAVQLLTMTNVDESYASGNMSSDKIDSVILYLPYSSIYPRHHEMDGKELTLTIYRINEELVDGVGFDSAYSSNREVSYDPVPVSGPITVYPKPFDTVYDTLSSSLIVKPLQLRLSNSFGKELVDIFRNMSDADRADLAGFPKHFKGIYIKAEPKNREGEDIVFSVTNLFADGANLSVFYNGSGTQTSYLKFLLGPLRYTHVKRDRSMSTDPLYLSQMENPMDTVSGSKRLYIEGSGGSRVRFRIPDFYKKVAGRIIVNQALLVVENANMKSGDVIGVPAKLECFKYINRGTSEQVLGSSTSSGAYDEQTGQYRVDITRYLQQLAFQTTVDPANEAKFLDFIDLAPESDERYEQPTRVVLYGPDAGERKMRLKVIYTIINDTIVSK